MPISRPGSLQLTPAAALAPVFPTPDSFVLLWATRNTELLKKNLNREKLNITTCADSSTNTKRTETDNKGNQIYICVMCPMSHVMSHLSRVTCHLSLMPTATVTDPPLTIVSYTVLALFLLS